ncbi:hypothetical protein GCM10023089_39530 [Quisquiliibacterium transsilvanicum]
MRADVAPAIHREPDGTVLLVYSDGRRVRIHPDGRIEGLGRAERLLLGMLQVFGAVRRRLTR